MISAYFFGLVVATETALTANRSSSPREQVVDIPLAERSFTGPRGGQVSFLRDEVFKCTFHGVTAARVILFDPNDPTNVPMRQGKSGRYGPMGGDLGPGENPIRCAIREVREESRVRRLPNLSFVTVLVSEGRGTWVDRELWDSWGYSTRGYDVTKSRIYVANIKTAIFAAPLLESLRSRHVENRHVALLDLEQPEHRQRVRPMFQRLFELWRLKQAGKCEIPSLIRYTGD